MEPIRTRLRLLAAFAGSLAAALCAAQGPGAKDAPFEALYREAYERRLRESGPQHPDTIASLVRLGALLRTHGRAQAAEPLLRQAMEARDPSDPAGRDTMVELGETLVALGRGTEAERLYARALEHTRPGPERARILLRIAKLREKGGDAASAGKAYTDALAEFGADTPQQAEDQRARAAALNDLGLLLEAQGEFDRAEALYRRSAEAHAEAFGSEHPATAAVRANLASTIALRGDAARAAELLERSVAVIGAAYGPRHDDAATLRNRLGEIYEALGRPEEAEAEYLAALASWPEPSLSRGLALADLGRLAGIRADFSGAEAALAEAVRLIEHAGDSVAVDLAEALDSYGSVLREMGRLDEAEPLLARALAIRDREMGASHPDVALSLVGLAGVLHLRGDLARARPLYRRALEIQERTLGPDHPEVGETLYNLAHLRLALGEEAAARDAFQRAAVVLSAAYGPSDPFVAEIRAALRALE